MSSYYDNDVKCPNCGHSPISCADNTPVQHEYTYICEQCMYRTKDYKKLTKLKLLTSGDYEPERKFDSNQ